MKEALTCLAIALGLPVVVAIAALSYVIGRLDTIKSNFVFGAAILAFLVNDVLSGLMSQVRLSYLILLSSWAIQGFFATVVDLSERVLVGVAALCFGAALYVFSEAHDPCIGHVPYASVLVMLSSILCPIVANKWWLPVSADKLKTSEETLLDLWIHNPVLNVNLSVVAGLGTYVVTESSTESYHTEDSKLKTGKVPLVLLHGYGAGNGYWALNIDGLSKAGFQVFCVELPGFGRSDRPMWQSPVSVDEALERFATSLEAWRRDMRIESFVLLGHSLGTHAASAYAIKHPSRVQHLVLASPVGVGLPPLRLRKQLSREALDCAEDGGVDLSTPHAAEQQQNRSTKGTRTTPGTVKSADDEGRETDAAKEKLIPKSPAAAVQETMSRPLQQQPLLFRATVAVFSWLWTNEFTPFDVTRLLGPFGPRVTAWAFRRRISRSAKNSYLRRLTPEQVSALDTYSYQNHAAPPSGERILNSILMPGAYARKPLVLWLHGGRGRGCINCPVTLLYGTRGVDWMQAEYGHELCGNLRGEGVDAVCLEMDNQVGHLNYLEDPAQFVAHLEEQVITNKRLR